LVEKWQEEVYEQREMEEAPENGKELSHSAHANEVNECKVCLHIRHQTLTFENQ
jgi:hypothetical protein